MSLAQVQVVPGKRFGDKNENLGLADLNDAGSPIMLLGVGSIGTAQFIYDDLFDIISDTALGIRIPYTFAEDRIFSAAGLFLVATLTVPEAAVGDAVQVTEPIDPGTGLATDIAVQFQAVPIAGSILLYAYILAPAVTVPAGTIVTVVDFTPNRIKPGQGNGPASMGAPAALPADTGFITVTPGHIWADGEGITVDNLDLTCQPTAAVANSSVGRREIDPDAVARIVASVRGGAIFTGRTPTAFTLNKGISATFDLVVAGATVGQVPLISSANGQADFELAWGGAVNTSGHIQVVMKNLAVVTRTIVKGTPFTGRLLG